MSNDPYGKSDPTGAEAIAEVQRENASNNKVGKTAAEALDTASKVLAVVAGAANTIAPGAGEAPDKASGSLSAAQSWCTSSHRGY
jgi:hypothetical protein